MLVVGLFAICLVVAAQLPAPPDPDHAGDGDRHRDARTRTSARSARRCASCARASTAAPFWAISLSIPAKNGKGYERVSVARVDANTGKLVAFTDNADTEKDAP